MNIIKKVPVPLSAVMLGMAALGNLLQSYGEPIRTVCGIISAFCLVLLLLKLIFFPKMIAEDLKQRIPAGVSATFPMALMLLSTYVKPLIGGAAKFIWLFAILLHIALIIYFTATFVVHFEWKNLFPVWYIVYVGIAVAGVTAPAYDGQTIGAAAFWFGLVSLIVLLPAIQKRYLRIPAPEPAKPLYAITAAPAALCTAAYVQSVAPKSVPFLLTLCAAANILYIIGLVGSVKHLSHGFKPTWGAYTFPFVIAAIATKQTMACLTKLEQPIPTLKPIVLVETIIAVCFMAFIFAKFMIAIFANSGSTTQAKKSTQTA